MTDNLHPETLKEILGVHRKSLEPLLLCEDGNLLHYYDSRKGETFTVIKKRGDRKIETSSLDSFLRVISQWHETQKPKQTILITIGFDKVSALIGLEAETKDIVQLSLPFTNSFATFSDLVEDSNNFTPSNLHKYWVSMWGPFGDNSIASIYPENDDGSTNFGEIMSEVELMVKRTKGIKKDDLGTGNVKNEAVVTIKAGDLDEEIPTRWVWDGYIYEESTSKSKVNWILQADAIGDELVFTGIDRNLSVATKSARESIIARLNADLAGMSCYPNVIICEGSFTEGEDQEFNLHACSPLRKIEM